MTTWRAGLSGAPFLWGPAMFRFLLGKLAYLLPTFIGITIVAFGFVRVLPGDPVLLMAGERGSISISSVACSMAISASRW